MKYSMMGLQVEEMSFALNTQALAKKDAKLEVHPQISGGVTRDPNNEKIWSANLMVRVVSTETAPAPFALRVRIRGIFEADGLVDDADRRVLAYNMVEMVFPHLRSTVTTLTANAVVRPLMLPMIPVENLFPPEAIFTETGVVVPKKEEDGGNGDLN